MDIQPLSLLRTIAQGHEYPNTEAFFEASNQALRLFCDVLPLKTIDVIIEGPPEYTSISPLSVLYDFVAALLRTNSATAGITDPDDSLGQAQLAVHNFVTRVMPHCKYGFKPRLTRSAMVRPLPARDTWGKLIVKSTGRLSSKDLYTPFKEVPPS
jgi:hypothetical protein